MNVDDEPPRVGKEKGGVVGNRADVEHDAGDVVGELRGADAFEEAVVDDFYRLAVQDGFQARAIEIKVDAVRVGDAGSLISDLILQVDGDAGIDGRGPMANAADQRYPAGVGDGDYRVRLRLLCWWLRLRLRQVGLSRRRGLLRLNGRRRCGFPLRFDGGREDCVSAAGMMDWLGGMLQLTQLLPGYIFPFRDLVGVAATAGGVPGFKVFVLTNRVVEKLYVGEEAALFG